MSLQGIEFGIPGTGDGTSNVPVPGVTGMSRAEAEQTLKTLGFKPAVTEFEAAGQPDVVLAQAPAESTLRPQGSEVTIVVIKNPVPQFDVETRFTALDDAVKAIDQKVAKVDEISTKLDGVATSAAVGELDKAVKAVEGKVDSQASDLSAISQKLDDVATSAAVSGLGQAVTDVGKTLTTLDGKFDDPVTVKLNEISQKLDQLARAPAKASAKQSS